MKILQTKEVRKPERANRNDSGIDFLIPQGCEIYLGPWDRMTVPLWIKCIIPIWYDLQLIWKSWLASKKWIAVLGGLIDNWYRGELSVVILNTSAETVSFMEWEKIVQGVVRPIAYPEIVEMSEEQFIATEKTERGEGGFGSTWK